ncbi:MAG: hypothetical protein NVS9B13_13170 [Candidatus Acidiferrum sp.]
METLDKGQSRERYIFRSTPRTRIFLHACLSALGLGVWLWVMNTFELNFLFLRFLGIFLILSTTALFLLAARRSRTVVMDIESFTLVRGRKQTIIPWSSFLDQKSKLMLEDVLAWQRLNIKAVSSEKKTTLGLDRIFGVGLPVREIAEIMRDKIKTVCGRDLSLD